LKTHRLFLVSAVELPVTKITASRTGELVDASWEVSAAMDNNTLVAYDTYTNAIGGLDPVKIGWRRHEVANADSSMLM
jgi:hypothetical protein